MTDKFKNLTDNQMRFLLRQELWTLHGMPSTKTEEKFSDMVESRLKKIRANERDDLLRPIKPDVVIWDSWCEDDDEQDKV